MAEQDKPLGNPQSSLLTVGIDIGTTSTHVTFCRSQIGSAATVEDGHYVIDRTKVFYESPIHLTPLTLQGLIDGAGVERLIADEYASAGIGAASVAGAVVITGDSSKKRNTSAVVSALSAISGRFIIASAGPHLESVFAARGSGAIEASRTSKSTICNIDIGGGTANIAIFKNGELVDYACLAIGGRFLQLTPQLSLIAITESGKAIALDALRLEIRSASQQSLSSARIAALADRAAQAIINVACLRKKFRFPDGWLESRVLMTAPLTFDGPIDEFWFSGGIAELMRDRDVPRSDTEYGDMGVFLARALKEQLQRSAIKYRIADLPIKATLLGATMEDLGVDVTSVEQTGASSIPICLIPVVRPLVIKLKPMLITDVKALVREDADAGPSENSEAVFQSFDTGNHGIADAEPPEADADVEPVVDDRREPEEKIAGDLAEKLAVAFKLRNLAWNEQPLALFLPELVDVDAGELGLWANALSLVIDRFDAAEPVVLIGTAERNFELALLLREFQAEKQLIFVDRPIDFEAGVIDIGAALAGVKAKYVVVQELVFAR